MRSRLRVLGLDVVMALAAVNIWTGSPLLALWIGSRLQSSTRPSVTAVFAVFGVMFGVSLLCIRILAAASAKHEDLTGRQRSVRRHVPWLRSTRGERVEWERGRAGLTTLERILVIAVVLAVLGFEAWFFLMSPSPIEPGPAKT
jgi:hypothetical protein